MMLSLEEELETTNSKIIEIEKNICVLQDNVMEIAEQLKETQRYLMMLAKNQAEITKRISNWPYIPVEKDLGDY